MAGGRARRGRWQGWRCGGWTPAPSPPAPLPSEGEGRMAPSSCGQRPRDGPSAGLRTDGRSLTPGPSPFRGRGENAGHGWRLADEHGRPDGRPYGSGDHAPPVLKDRRSMGERVGDGGHEVARPHASCTEDTRPAGEREEGDGRGDGLEGRGSWVAATKGQRGRGDFRVVNS